jgi:hypothetical protein
VRFVNNNIFHKFEKMLQPPQKVGVVVVNSKAERLAPGPEIKP